MFTGCNAEPAEPLPLLDVIGDDVDAGDTQGSGGDAAGADDDVKAASGEAEVTAGLDGGGTRSDANAGDCTSDAMCGVTGHLCLDGVCKKPVMCKSDKQCAAVNAVCNSEFGVCVRCLTDNDCQGGGRCVGFRCRAKTPECTSSKQCHTFDLVCDKAAGACVDCVIQSDCTAWLACADHACVTPSCTAADNTCTGEKTARLCKDDGTGMQDVTCPVGTCMNGACPPFECVPGEIRCAGSAVQLCGDDGEWSAAKACQPQHVCMAGGCKKLICTAGDKACQANHVKTCTADGLGWTTPAPCPGGHICQAGVCNKVTCDVGDKLCTEDGEAAVCKADGSGWIETPCAGGDKCLDGGCKTLLCAPGKVECVGGMLKACNGTGTAQTLVKDCTAAANACQTTGCKNAICQVFAKACDDGNPCTVDACDGTTGCTKTPATDGSVCLGTGTCKSGACCTCAAGQVCNAVGTCVSLTSCKGRCGGYTASAKCQCDDTCSKYGDCCADKPTVCGSCDPSKAVGCSGDVLLIDNTCLGKQVQLNCVFGCDDKNKQCKLDPCAGYAITGACAPGNQGYKYCKIATDGGPKKLVAVQCASNEQCTTLGPFPTCKLKPGGCVPGTNECVAGSADLARTCKGDGTWEQYPCTGCKTAGGTTTCGGGVNLGPRTVKVFYEHIVPKPDYSALNLIGPQIRAPVGAMVLALRYSTDQASSTILASAEVASDGSFTIQAPTAPIEGRDYLTLLAAGYGGTGQAVFAVFDPGLSTGEHTTEQADNSGAKVYSWAAPVSAFKVGTEWTIELKDKSFALQTMTAIAQTWLSTAKLFGKQGRTIAAFTADGVAWDCGSCFGPWPTTHKLMGATVAQSQIWLDGAKLRAHMSDSTLFHEMGHWVMDSFATSPNEGGPHYIGTKVPPGQAWSEGWATFYGAMSRNDSRFAIGAPNQLYWVDLATSKTNYGASILNFAAGNPLVQFMDENRVAAALWRAAVKGFSPLEATANKGFWTALASNQMNDGVFTRSYFRHHWTGVTPNTGGPYNATYIGLKQTTQRAPCLIDYLDALACKAPTMTSALGTATAPMSFPFNQPICKP